VVRWYLGRVIVVVAIKGHPASVAPVSRHLRAIGQGSHWCQIRTFQMF